MKKALILILTFAMLLTLTPLGIFAEDTPDASDTTEYLSVSTKEEFLAMEAEKSYKLENDIDFGGDSFENYLIETFNGNLDGQGHCIYNFSLQEGGEDAADKVVYGIFHYLTATNGQTIKNLSIGKADAHLTLNYPVLSGYTGVLAAEQKDGSSLTLENVHIYADVTIQPASGGHRRFGGFVGYMTAVSMKNCSFNGAVNISTPKGNVICGAFGGYSDAGDKSFVDCVNHATVTITGVAKTFVGGFIGWENAAGKSVVFKNCINNGTISATAPNTCDVGGFCGVLNAAFTMENCINYGAVSSNGTAGIEIGGLLGVANSATAVSVTACVNKGIVQVPETNTGAVVGGFLGARYGVGAIAISHSVNTAAVSGAKATVGALIGKTAVNATLTNCFNYGSLTAATVAAKGFVGNGTFTEADLYDLRGEAVPACTYEALAGVGVQKSDPVDNKMNIRFVAGIDSAEFTAVGYDIKIYNAGKVATLSVEDYQVYEQINAKAENGVNTAVTAESQGVNYLIALTLTSVPTTAAFGEVTFVITPYAKNAQGEKVIGHSWMCMVQTGNLILNVNV